MPSERSERVWFVLDGCARGVAPGRLLLIWRALACLALAVFPAFSPAVTSKSFGDIAVIAEGEAQGNISHGYMEFRIAVHNHSTTAAHQVTLTIPDDPGYARETQLRAISRTVEVGPGASAQVSLYLPAIPGMFGTGLAVTVDGRRAESGVPLEFPNFSRFGGGRRYGAHFTASIKSIDVSQPLILLGSAVPADFAEKAKVPGAVAPAGGVTPEFQVQVARVASASGWSTSWLGYSHYDGVVVTSAELAALPPDVRTALFQYVECGGVLLVLGKTNLPENWGREAEQGGFQGRDAGFGKVLVGESSNYRTWGSRWTFLHRVWLQTAQPFANTISVAEAHRAFPVVADVGVPVGGLFVVMLTFVILIGPVNLLFLAHIKRRLWMLWTVPLLSFVTCAAVFGYMAVAEGWAGHLRTEVLTVLDESTHRAATLGWTGFYSPLTPSGGLHFSPATELSWQSGGDAEATTAGSECRVDWTADQHLAQGWVSPRVPSHFMVRKNEIRRERVALRRGADGKLTLVNGLGATATKFWYRDENGAVFAATDVPPGAEAVLGPTELTDAEKPSKPGTLRQVYLTSWPNTIRQLAKSPASVLQPRTYVAVLDDAPFLEDGLHAAKSRQCSCVVIGKNKGVDGD